MKSKIARLLMNGRRQVVRLPKELSFKEAELQ